LSRRLSKSLTILAILVSITVLSLPALFLFMFSSYPVGHLSFLEEAPTLDELSVPQQVVEDAEKLVQELAANYVVQREELIAELLAAYSVARDKDFLILCNPGGFGRKEKLDDEWGSVISGIKSILEEMGYSVALVQYVRTPEGAWHYLKEFREMISNYPKKAKMLKAEVEFFTKHIDGLKVVLAGNSDGGVYTNEVTQLLANNSRVYSIICGLPFYYRSSVPERALVINDNGVIPDVLASGNVASLIWANVTHLPTHRAPEGHVLLYFRAPGHIYTWDHARVRTEITSFLKTNFGRD